MDELARLAETYGSGDIRLTMAQKAIIPNVKVSRLNSLLDQDLLQEFTPMPSPFRRNVVACTGTDFCNLAQIDTKRHAEDLASALEQRMGTPGEPLSFHWSGCPAGCGNHQASDIGFRGLKAKIDGELVESVAIYVNGRTGPRAAAGEQILDVVACDSNLARVVTQLIDDRDRQSDGVISDEDSPAELPLKAFDIEQDAGSDVGRG
jgi:ferredoxin-nitrite reductase